MSTTSFLRTSISHPRWGDAGREGSDRWREDLFRHHQAGRQSVLSKEDADTATQVVSMPRLPAPTDDLLIVGVAVFVVGLTWPSDLGRQASRTGRPTPRGGRARLAADRDRDRRPTWRRREEARAAGNPRAGPATARLGQDDHKAAVVGPCLVRLDHQPGW